MLRVSISASGKLNEPFWRSACREYEKRLAAYCRLDMLETPETKPPPIPKADRIIALCIEGELISSEVFAKKLEQWQIGGASHIAFIIGSSDGLPERLKAQAHERMSLSPMTWPHALARVLLLEQLYRSLNIIGGGKYHK